MRSPFSLFKYKTQSGFIWYARFYDQKSGEVIKTKSTGIPCTGKKGKKIEAYKKAELILNELGEENKSPYFIPYLESFWTENSPYVKSKRIVEKKPLSNLYIEINVSVIKNHIKPYKPFQKIRLSELKPGMIEDWKLWALEKNKTGTRRVNTSLNCMKVAVRYSVSRGDISNDPFKSIKKVAYSPREKGILNQKEVGKLINSRETDHRVKLAVLLAVLSGLRRGEVRGLRWKDIDRENGLINVQNNYVDTEGAKGCKAFNNLFIWLSTLFEMFIYSITWNLFFILITLTVPATLTTIVGTAVAISVFRACCFCVFSFAATYYFSEGIPSSTGYSRNLI